METRKERRQRIQKELNDGKILHRIGVLRERLKTLDSEAAIVRNEIQRLESRNAPPTKDPTVAVLQGSLPSSE